jgi:putative PIN family toxin of toxin-antitoxin system
MMSHAISCILRLVLDTDVMVAAMRSRSGASWQLVDGALAKEFTLLLSVPLVLEYESVLKRDEHRRVHRLTHSELDDILGALVKVADPVKIRFHWRPLLPDPNDDMVLETAVNGQADLLVTFNQGDFAIAGKPFRHRSVLPREALQLLRSRQAYSAKDDHETK